MNTFTLTERDACVWFDSVTRRLRGAEAAGVPLPGWLTSMAGAILVAEKEKALSPQARLFLLVGFSGAYAGLSAELRNEIERSSWEGVEVPDVLPEEINGVAPEQGVSE